MNITMQRAWRFPYMVYIPLTVLDPDLAYYPYEYCLRYFR